MKTRIPALGLVTLLFPVLLSTASCGGSGADLPIIDSRSLDTFLASGSLKVTGINRNGLNPSSVTAHLELVGTAFSNLQSYEVTLNGSPVAFAPPTSEGTTLDVPLSLIEGKNVLRIVATESAGRPIYVNEVLYSGGNTLSVNLKDGTGTPITQATSVTLSLSDDPTVRQTVTTSSGVATFTDVPARTVVVQATSSSNLSGVAGDVGNIGSLDLTMTGVGAASSIANNDFSAGIAGWDVGTAPATIVDHVETIGTASREHPVRQSRVPQHRRLFPALPPTTRETGNKDLQLSTSGEGPQSVSRTFTTEAGINKVSVRYRFVTSEVPGGFFGSEFNDYYSVRIRSGSGGNVAEANTMNGLGLAAFDANGSTQWRTAELEVNPAGDTVQVDLTVANVEDDAYDSQVIVDFIEADKPKIKPKLEWDSTAGGLKLTYTVEGSPLDEPVEIKVFWAKNSTYGSRLGNSFFSTTVPKDTPVGQGGPIAIPADKLVEDPKDTAFIIASVSATNIGFIQDVKFSYDANADSAKVTDAMKDILKDAGRAAGQAEVTISSTARTAQDQARAMFQNLTNPANSLDVNIQNQLALYAQQGDSVINVFRGMSQGKSRDQVVQQQESFITAMENKIVAVGPSNVSSHCADPAVNCVVDVGTGNMKDNASLFSASASPRVTKFIDEVRTNTCFHFELKS